MAAKEMTTPSIPFMAERLGLVRGCQEWFNKCPHGEFVTLTSKGIVKRGEGYRWEYETKEDASLHFWIELNKYKLSIDKPTTLCAAASPEMRHAIFPPSEKKYFSIRARMLIT